MTIQRDNTRSARLGAEYQAVAPPSEVQADQPLLLRVSVRNTGAVAWANQGAHPVNLGYHWLATDGRVIDFDGLRASLPAPLPPGDVAELELQVEPPGPGEYMLALDMVEEGVGWFSQHGVASLTLPLVVAESAAHALRICIVAQICLINDAVGNHILYQARLLRSWGYQVQVMVEVVDQRQPYALRQLMAPISFEDLRDGRETTLNRRALTSFRTADISIFHFPVQYPLFEAIRLVERGIVIVDYHGITPPHLWGTEGKEYERLVASQRQIALVRYADYAIAHSSYARDELLQNAAILPERIYQMPYAVELDRFHPGPRPAALAMRYGLADDQPVLLYVGRMAANKRVTDLVCALAHIRGRYPGAVLLLIGDNRSEAYALIAERVSAQAAHLGVADGVIFAGQVSDEELAAHYQLADIFVTASLHEGFCIPVIEAIAGGLPVVGAHTTALPETIGAAGLTFQPENPADLAHKVLEILDGRAESGRTNDKMIR